MNILITGATGQLGRELVPRLLKRGDRLTLLVRDTDKAGKMFPGCELIKGDVTSEGLGINRPPRPDAVYHLAADIDLGAARDSRVWAVNFRGTVNAVNFCLLNSVPCLFYAGTAYTEKGRNSYERSKKAAEEFVEASDIGRKTIFKLGILVPGAGEAGSASAGALYQFVNAIARVLDRAGRQKRALRIKGLPEARLNLVHSDLAADFIAGAVKPGKFWLTHPDPVKLSELAEWVGEVLGARIKFEPDFKMSAAEALFHRGVKPFLPYLQGDDFPGSLCGWPRVTEDFVKESAAAALSPAMDKRDEVSGYRAAEVL
ncbi:MAG: SDR family oxidoreductase [Elusimicrobiota bacterium]|nr:SDR family oxidoreductase [Elusimicrobiota bacterium]